MRVYIHDHPQNVTVEEFEKDLRLLPQWRREKALTYHFLIDRVLCAKAYLLLCQALREGYGIFKSPNFGFIKHDKPVLLEYPQILFNLSHCKRAVLCVTDDEPVGCDIEEIEKKLDLNLCRICFNDKEIARIQDSPAPCIEFTKLWTMKEAVLKLTGEGINDNLPSLLTPELLARLEMETHVRADLGFVYTICRYRE